MIVSKRESICSRFISLIGEVRVYTDRIFGSRGRKNKQISSRESNIYHGCYKTFGCNKREKVKLDGPLCGELYKEDHGSIIPWSGTDPDAKMNSFTWSTNKNDWIILREQYTHARSLQALSILMEFLGKESQQYPSSPTRINAVSI